MGTPQAGPQTVCRVSQGSRPQDSAGLLGLASLHNPLVSVTAPELACRSRCWLGFSMGHMEALCYNHAVCERNVGSGATSLPECGSPGLRRPRRCSVLTLPSHHSCRTSLGRTPGEDRAGGCSGQGPARGRSPRLLPGYCFHHAVRRVQGAGAWSQNLRAEKNQKPVQIHKFPVRREEDRG